VAMRTTAKEVIALTDKVCADLLDDEYADLARQVTTRLAPWRPSGHEPCVPNAASSLAMNEYLRRWRSRRPSR
jgi:hypothetical protein